jgi:hypothetical protein
MADRLDAGDRRDASRHQIASNRVYLLRFRYRKCSLRGGAMGQKRFDSAVFLSKVGAGKTIVACRKDQVHVQLGA